jgi:lysophospholipase L1-like esterase
MKKILTFIIVLLSVFLIYLGFKDKKVYYLSLGDYLSLGKNPYNILDYGYSDYVKDYLENKKILETYVDGLNREDKRIIDIISDINNNQKVLVNNKEKTIQNVLIKSDLITLSIGSNDLLNNVNINYEFNENDLYNKFEQLLVDYENLFKLLREYCKENIILIGLYNNLDDIKLDEFFNYANVKLKQLCDEYDIKYIKISDEFKNDEYFPNPLNLYPNKEGYIFIGKEIIKLIENK